MIKKEIQKLKSIFKFYPQIKLVYFFGSKASGDDGPLSDYDFALYFNEKDKNKMFDIKLELFDKISRLLKTDKIDLVVLNTSESPELKYNIIKDGKLIYERELYRVEIESRILNEYFDFHSLLLRYNLTQAI